MATTRKHKKNLIVSYKNLPDDIKKLFKEAYPEGHENYITKFVKPNGEAIFVVPFETEETAYMVKFDVKVDTLGEDLDKALFDDDGGGNLVLEGDGLGLALGIGQGSGQLVVQLFGIGLVHIDGDKAVFA